MPQNIDFGSICCSGGSHQLTWQSVYFLVIQSAVTIILFLLFSFSFVSWKAYKSHPQSHLALVPATSGDAMVFASSNSGKQPGATGE